MSRDFDGEAYYLHGDKMTKPDAKREAHKLREGRYKARVVREGGRWSVYRSRSRANPELKKYR